MTDPGAASLAEAPGYRRIVVDACILINYLRLGRLALLVESASLRPVVTQSVIDEITDRSQLGELEGSISAGHIELIDPDPTALDTFISAIESGLGRGEASCIALSSATGILLGCDEMAGCFTRFIEATGLSGRVMTTRDLMVMAIDENRLGLDDANALLDTLRTRLRYNVEDIRQCEVQGNHTI